MYAEALPVAGGRTAEGSLTLITPETQALLAVGGASFTSVIPAQLNYQRPHFLRLSLSDWMSLTELVVDADEDVSLMEGSYFLFFSSGVQQSFDCLV